MTTNLRHIQIKIAGIVTVINNTVMPPIILAVMELKSKIEFITILLYIIQTLYEPSVWVTEKFHSNNMDISSLLQVFACAKLCTLKLCLR